MKHRLLLAPDGDPIGAAYLGKHGQQQQEVALVWAIDEHGRLWPWFSTADTPFTGEVDHWPAHEHEGRIMGTMSARLRSTGRACVGTTTAGARCRRLVCDGAFCPRHKVDDADYRAAAAAFTAGYGYRHDADGHHLIYLDSGRDLGTFATADQLAAHCEGSPPNFG